MPDFIHPVLVELRRLLPQIRFNVFEGAVSQGEHVTVSVSPRPLVDSHDFRLIVTATAHGGRMVQWEGQPLVVLQEPSKYYIARLNHRGQAVLPNLPGWSETADAPDLLGYRVLELPAEWGAIDRPLAPDTRAHRCQRYFTNAGTLVNSFRPGGEGSRGIVLAAQSRNLASTAKLNCCFVDRTTGIAHGRFDPQAFRNVSANEPQSVEPWEARVEEPLAMAAGNVKADELFYWLSGAPTSHPRPFYSTWTLDLIEQMWAQGMTRTEREVYGEVGRWRAAFFEQLMCPSEHIWITALDNESDTEKLRSWLRAEPQSVRWQIMNHDAERRQVLEGLIEQRLSVLTSSTPSVGNQSAS